MNIDLSFKANSPCVESNRWIASLSDGRTVFEDRIPNAPSAWIRLQQFVKEQRLYITRLRLQAYGVLVQLPPLRDENDHIQFQGYWHAKRHDALVSNAGLSQTLSYGVGYIKNGFIYIQWIRQNGSVEEEIRGYDRKTDLAGILHDEISVDNDANHSAR